MNTAEQRAMNKLGVTEEAFKLIQEAHKLFSGLWDDDAFIELWQSIPDEACEALFKAVRKIEEADQKVKDLYARIDKEQMKIREMGERLVYEYAENGSETTKEVAIRHMGECEFFAELLTGGYDLTEDDREEIAELLR